MHAPSSRRRRTRPKSHSTSFSRERRGRLVEEQDPRLAHERRGDLDDLPLREGERAGERARIDAVHAEALEDLLRGLGELPPLDRAASGRAARARRTGSPRRSSRGRASAPGTRCRRRGAGRADGPETVDVLAVDPHRAGVGLDRAAEDLDQRALAGAVLADERVHLAEPRREGRLGERRRPRRRNGRRRRRRSPAARRVLGVVAHRSGMRRVEDGWWPPGRARAATSAGEGLGGKPDLQRSGAGLAGQRRLDADDERRAAGRSR